jgi:hypothetical protein
MSDLERRLRSELPDIAASVTVEELRATDGRRSTERWVAGVVGLIVVVLAVGAVLVRNDAKKEPLRIATTTTVPGSRPGDALVFREVLGTTPCEGRLVTPPAEQTATASVVLSDREKAFCFALGPTLLTGHNVSAADAVYDETQESWVVNVHFANDDFLQKVALVEVNKSIAIIVDGVLQSVARVNPGITGTDVQINGPSTDEASARRTAATIDPSSASRIPETPTTTALDILDQRCDAVASRMKSGPLSVSSTVTADMARSALRRAHEAVPAALADLDGSVRLALCYFTPTFPTAGETPTTVCPNGDIVGIGEAPDAIMYAVDANLKMTKLPGVEYLLPPGTPIPSPLGGADLCAGLPSG